MGSTAFVPRGGAPENTLAEVKAHPGVYTGAVIMASWAQLEPSPGVFDFKVIDDALVAVRAYNSKYPATPLVAKLRIYNGASAPVWVKSLGGAPLPMQERQIKFTTGRYWSDVYRSEWKRLQDALAARYDTHPLVAEVAISSCGTLSAEPFVASFDGSNIQVLHAAGYTDASKKACLLAAADDYAAWQHVALDFSFTTFRTIDSGHVQTDLAFTLQVMNEFRRRYAARAVLANHGADAQVTRNGGPVDDALHTLGKPIEFQTAGPQVNWDAAVQTALRYGVSELEVWDSKDAGGLAPISMAQLQRWKAALRGALP